MEKSPCHDSGITPKGTCDVCGKQVAGATVDAGESTTTAAPAAQTAPAAPAAPAGPVLKKYKVIDDEGFDGKNGVIAKGEVVELDPEGEEAKLGLEEGSLEEVVEEAAQ